MWHPIVMPAILYLLKISTEILFYNSPMSMANLPTNQVSG